MRDVKAMRGLLLGSPRAGSIGSIGIALAVLTVDGKMVELIPSEA